MSMKTTYSPTVPEERAASSELCPLFTCCIGYWEACRHFQGVFFLLRGGGSYVGESFHEELFLGEKNLP